MKGKKDAMRRMFIPFCCAVFLSFYVVGVFADDVFRNDLYLVLGVDGDSVSLQSATLVGALNTGGAVYTDSGVRAVNEDDEEVPVLSTTSDGGLCVGACRDEGADDEEPQDESAGGETSIYEQGTPGEEETGTTTSSSTSSEQEEVEEATSQATTSTATSSQSESEDDEDDENAHTPRRSGGSGSASEEDDETEEDTSTSTATSTGSSTDVDIDEESNSGEEGDSPIETFLLQLASLVKLVDGRMGIGMQPLADFALAVRGWIFASEGIIVGDASARTGLGVASEGICLGACDFVFASSSEAVEEEPGDDTNQNGDEGQAGPSFSNMAATTSSSTASSTATSSDTEYKENETATTSASSTTVSSDEDTTPKDIATSTASSTATTTDESSNENESETASSSSATTSVSSTDDTLEEDEEDEESASSTASSTKEESA